jgi:hypothetical protein
LLELACTTEDISVVRRLTEIAAAWVAFHLAQDEYKARAVVQKAREMAGQIGQELFENWRARAHVGRECQWAHAEIAGHFLSAVFNLPRW